MKLRKTTFFAILSLVAFYSCKKDTDVNMESFKIVKEVEKVTAGTTSATITGMYEYSGRIDGIKVRVGTSEQLFGSDVYVAEMSGKAYSVNITGLRSGTKYHYRYEIDYGAKEDYLTEIYDFTTLSEAPTVKILAIDPLNNDSTSFAITCMVVDANGGPNLPEYVTECGICWNNYPNGNPTLDDEKHPYTDVNNPYTIRMENLPTRTVYHVKAYAKSSAGTGFSEKESFRTGGETTKPQVSTVEVSNVTYNAATCLCNVSSDGGLELTERGVCWGLEPDPTVNVHKVTAEGTETGNYTVTIEGLNPNADYHVRAYAINEKGIAYGEDLPFTTTDGKPTVTTSGITEITSTSAKGGGEVTDQGADPVTERGICWSTSHEPMATGNHATSGTGTGSFICDMTNLTPNQTYYVRAYATNSKGTAYGDEVDFMAMEGLPSVETVDVTNVTTSSAKVNYKVTIEGGLEVDEHGICWSESNTIPTINDHYVSGGNGTGTFSVDLTGLNPGTKYYVRAYAKNEQGGEAYGTAKDFTTEATLPTVTTDGIEGTTAHGTVSADGGKPVTERGICWGLNHNPTTADLHDSNGTGLGSYAVPLTDLQPGKTYYYRAYATNEMGTAYGLEGPPLVVEANPPTVNTGEVSNIQQTTAQGSGNVTDGGGAEVTERGVCWSTSPNPTIANSHADDGVGGLGNFTVPMTGLTANTHYYVRAYAKNREGKIGYGSQTDFTTAQSISAPTVTTTSPITNITQTTATGGGNVTNDGGSPVTERGICWSTSHNPTISGSHSSNGTGTGAYQVNMTGLTPGTTYYVRAYAKNNANLIGYGTEVQFTTQQQTTYTITVLASPSNGGSAHVGSPTGPTTGTYTSGQQCTVYAVANTNYTFTNWTENGQVVQGAGATYSFPVTASRTLVANFITKPTVITTDPVTNIQQTTATGGGNVTSSGGATVTARGVCWSTSSNPTINNSHTTDGTGTGNFTSSITGLTAGTLYHVRAYATNSAGTAYGADVTFTTQQVPTYTITVSANPSNGGSAHVGSTTGPTTGTYTNGQQCTVYAVANSNYTFTNWTENGQVVQGAGATYTFPVTANRTLVANFITVPTVITTDPVTNIQQTTATGGGNVTNSGGATVTARGVCWSTSSNPTINNSHTTNGTGTGIFTSSITGLTAGTLYHVRAYATNSAGTAYGADVTFTTQQVPTYTITVYANPSNGGYVTGGGTYNYGTTVNLTANAYSGFTFGHWQDGNTNNPRTITVTGYATYTAYFEAQPQAPEGAINGKFTINANGDKVYFSKGNLQYNKTTQVWSFMEHQYDIVETNEQNVGENYANQNIVSLFGWGTSGYHDSNDPYNVNYQPWSTSKSSVNLSYNWNGYGPSTNMPSPNLTGSSANYDWGVYNTVYSGSVATTGWRTLTGGDNFNNNEEWYYVFNGRTTPSGIRYAKAEVNGVNGVILLPDNWSISYFTLNSPNTPDASFSTNVITAQQWNILEQYGVVFLPAAGDRNGITVEDVGSDGYYWSASSGGSFSEKACGVCFFRGIDAIDHFFASGIYDRCYGRSVRLVCPAN